MATNKQRIIPHLWYDKEAQEVAEFYTSIFPDSTVGNVTTLRDTPSGDTDTVSFRLWGQQFVAIGAGPPFKFNPSISFVVNFDPLFFDPSPSREEDAREKMDQVWETLSEGGTALMPIDKHPFSARYGWIQDKYGLSWQLILTDPEGDPRPPIMPAMLFAGENCGKAEEAIDFYLSVFKNSKQGSLARYEAGQEPEEEGTVMFADFMLENQWFVAMDSGREHDFAFSEAISFIVYCDDQEEIDGYWKSLSAVPEAEQCGWLKDKYGVSWQIVPSSMEGMMRDGSEEQIERVTQAFLKMKKLDLAELQQAYDGKTKKEDVETSVSSHTKQNAGRSKPYLVLTEEDYHVLGPDDFGAPGLEAIEVLGPHVEIQASGPLITIHDSTVEPRRGVGHHLHRHNERLFYILAGELDHDDRRNDIQGHMGPGDVGLFTEGQGGMLHSEWNNGDVPTRAYILVYTTDPVPEETSFTPLRDADAPRYEEGDGVRTKELVGDRSELRVHGDLRSFTDTTIEDGSSLTVALDDGEGGLLAIREGRVRLEGREIGAGATVLLPPAEGEQSVTVEAQGATRILRAVYGPGQGFVRRS